VSLRLRLLLAFAYGFLLIVIALEVPLALNLRRRVDAEVRNDAAGQAHIVAAQASGSMAARCSSGESRIRRPQLGARVIVVDSAGCCARIRREPAAVVREQAGDPDCAHRPDRSGDAPQRHARRGPCTARSGDRLRSLPALFA
jgi:hypothetical protein